MDEIIELLISCGVINIINRILIISINDDRIKSSFLCYF